MRQAFFVLCVTSFLMAGCGSDTDSPSSGASDGTILVNSSELPVGDSTCPFGGTLVEMGLDNGDGEGEAGDGVLHAGEVDETTTICNEESTSSGADILIETADIEEGDEQCPFGGSLVEIGLDNGDGGGIEGDEVLQAGEVDETHAVCNDDPATTSPEILVEVSTVDFGDDTCPFGGSRIDIGRDDGTGGGTASDGILQPGEVEETEYSCSDDPAGYVQDTLSTSESVPVSDANCPFGGTQVDYGQDDGNGEGTADDGILHEDEVDGSDYICLDAESGLLVVVEELTWGDEDCPTGGQRIISGIDDGRDGGTADDGILDPGEIRDTETLCHIELEDVFEPVVGEVGGDYIDLRGGDGEAADGIGGEGGSMSIRLFAGPLPGAVELYAHGQANASFELPPSVFEEGTHPIVIDEDYLVPAIDEEYHYYSYEDPPEGLHARGYVDDQPMILYDGADIVTSLQINPGITLTFQSYNDEERATIEVQGDINNLGTITVSGDDGYLHDLHLICANFYSGVGSIVTTQGSYGSGEIGIFAIDEDGGRIINQGTIISAGSTDPDEPGQSNDIELFAVGDIYNIGVIDTHGGDALNDAATSGSPISLVSPTGDVFNSGLLNLSGGTGTVGANAGRFHVRTAPTKFTGVGDSRYTEQYLPGSFVNSGELGLSGGDGLDGAGGNGGNVDVELLAGNLFSSGDLDLSGGSGDESDGGHAGSLFILSRAWSDIDSSDFATPELIAISGNLLLSGGSSTYGRGGAGGDMEIVVDVSLTEDPEYSSLRGHPFNLAGVAGTSDGVRVQFLGFGDGLLASAGYGGGSSADAGSLVIENAVCLGSEPNCVLPTIGSRWIYSNVDVTAAGGSSEYDDGGAGGQVTFVVESSRNLTSAIVDESRVENHGALFLDGGASDDGDGGTGGDVFMTVDAGLVLNAGSVEAVGGDTCPTCAGDDAGDGGELTLIGFDVHQSGDLLLSAGSGNMALGGVVTMMGYTVTNEGAIVTTGSSNSEGDENNVVGGTGGHFEITAVTTLANSGDIASTGGSGSSVSGYLSGGSGGTVRLSAETIINDGDIDISGGGGVSTFGVAEAGSAGWMVVRGETISNSGAIVGNAGSSVGSGETSAEAGSGASLDFFADTFTNTGPIEVNGGSLVHQGGTAGFNFAGSVHVSARVLNNEAPIHANGGTLSMEAGEIAYENDGGTVELSGETVSNSGEIQVNGGQTTVTVNVDDVYGNDGGSVLILGDNSGDIQANGGTVSGEPADMLIGSYGGQITVTGDNSGCLEVNAGTEGEAGSISIDGTNTGVCY